MNLQNKNAVRAEQTSNTAYKDTDIVFPPGADPSASGVPFAKVYQNENHSAPAVSTFQLPKRQGICTFLTGQTGKCISVTFAPNEGMGQQLGILIEVGDNYIVLQEFASQNLFICDIQAIRFIHIYNDVPQTGGEKRSLFGI